MEPETVADGQGQRSRSDRDTSEAPTGPEGLQV